MNLYILDTDTLSLLERGDDAIYDHIISREARQIATTVITVEEQMQGRLHRIREAKTRESLLTAYQRLAETTDALRRLSIVGFSAEAIARYELLWGLKLNVGKNDLRIAAIALEHGAIVVTRNKRDFERVPGLVIEDWSTKVD